MSHIFISHVEEDTALARELARGIEAAGYGTWHYQRDTVPGAPYLIQVGKAIEECGAFVLIVSPKSLGSNQVTSEVVRAFEAGKHFIPVLSGITDAEFKERQPLWRQALSASTSILIPPQGVSAILPRILEGLKALGVKPEAPISTSGGHTPRHLADKILASRKIMEGERKQVTVLFADVSSFTSMSEKLDPEEVHNLVSEILVFLAEEVHRYEGTIAQFLGDGIMALFGAPIAHEDAPQRALHAALGIRERIREYAARLKPQGIEFDMHLGVNTGLVIVGRIGDDLTMEYTAIGDTVNLASRMESTATPGTIRVAESTYRLTEGYFEFKPLGEIEVKGKEQPVKAYQLAGVGQAKTRLGASVAPGLTPFVGRRKELEHLSDCYERVKKGQGQVVGIVGEAGVGKSRLLLQMRETLSREECSYLEGGCFHYGDAVPYLPMLNILRLYFGIDEGEAEPSVKQKMKEKISQLDPRLETLLPPLHDIFSLKVDDEPYLKLDAPLKRMRIFEGIRDLMVRESQDRPLVLAVEDLHWIDKTSEELLGYLIGFLANARILLVLLYRPEYTHQWGSKSYYSQIGVDQLPLNTSAEMVQAMLHEGKAAPELQELILSRAAGNPLFMEELTRSLFDRGLIQRRNGHYVLTAKPADIQVPDTVQGIIAARMDRLEESLKQTVQVASVIGREFGLRLLQSVTGEGEEVKSHLLSLQGLELVYQKSLFPEPEYIFKHALTQDVAYNSLLLKRRKEVHGRIGKAIEELYPDRLEEFYEMLAHHYSKAEDSEKAYHYLKLSGDKATKNYAKWEALGFYQGAIDLLKRQPDTEQNKRKGIEIRLLMSTPMRYLTYPEGSLPVLEEGERLCRELGDEKSLAQFLNVISVYYTFKGDSLRGLQYAEECFKEAERAQEIELMAAIGLGLFPAYAALGQFLRIADMTPKVIAAIEASARQLDSFGWGLNVYAVMHGNCGNALACLGYFLQAERYLQRALRFAEEIKDLYCIGYLETQYAWACAIRGDGRSTLAHGENAVKHVEETQFLTILGTAHLALGWGHFLLEELETARQHAEKGLESNRAVGFSMLSYQYYELMTFIYLHLGDWASALRYADEGLKSAQAHGERSGEGALLYVLASALGKADSSQAARAEECILQGIRIEEDLEARPYCAHGYLHLGELYADTGREAKALETLKKAEGMFREMGMDYWLARAEKALEKVKASG